MARRMKAALAALALGAAAMATGAAQAQPREGGHGGAQGGPRGGAAPRGQGGYRGGGYGEHGGWGGYRGRDGWRGYGGPHGGYGYYGWAPWGWYPYAPYYPGYSYDYGWYDDGGYDDYAPPEVYEPGPPPQARLAPRPAPRAAAASRDFVVYFPFDSAELTPQAKQVIEGAARYDAGIPDARATIVGYTDAAGAEGYNQALSERRSRAVREALLAAGIDEGTVDMAWKGKHDQAIKTADGVREPQNRRVTIVIRGASDLAYGEDEASGQDDADD